jgi:hypothetical protein
MEKYSLEKPVSLAIRVSMDHGFVTCYYQVTTVPFSTFVPFCREESIVGGSISSSFALRERLIVDEYC